jgi:SAM-dependent methyltransferase
MVPLISCIMYSRATCVFLFALLVVSGLDASAFVLAKSFRRHLSVPLRATWSDSSFDFSTPQGWEHYYRTGSDDEDEEEEDAQVVVEWHASVPLEAIADMVPLEAKCLMVGTGLSHLPAAVLDQRKASITLQDSSETCMQRLMDRYGETMQYAAGDATKLSDFIQGDFDMVIDKGLMDAIFCGEGWDSPIEALIKESCRVLKTGGAYLLVSYVLPTSTREFLVAAGNKVGLEWEFDGEGSNDRVGISIARKVV